MVKVGPRNFTADLKRSEQFLTVQALRLVAALAVVILHSSFYTSERLNNSLGVYGLGTNGVRLFFVISGFVMVMSSGRLVGTDRAAKVFAIKRFLRIVPLYWLVTTFKLIVLLSTTALVLHARFDWGYIIKSYLFIPAVNVDREIRPLLGVGWTLNFEMFFYFLFTLALLFKVDPTRFIAPILITLSGLSLLIKPSWPVPLQFFCDPIVLDFLAGMLIANWRKTENFASERVGWILLALGVAYLFVLFPRPTYGVLISSLGATLAAGLTVVGAVLLESRIGSRIPRPILFMGAASYSLYLVHPVIAPLAPAMLAKFGIMTPLLAIIASIAIATFAGAICYFVLEKPMGRVLDAASRRQGLFDVGNGCHVEPPIPTSPD